MLFFISLTIFTLILTVFENIFLAISMWFFVWFVTTTYLLIKKGKSKIWKNIGIITLALCISIASIFIKNYSYNKKIDTLNMFTWLIYQDMDGPVWQYFVGTWIISDIYSYQKFIFQDNDGREYFLRSASTYQIWDKIWLNWYVSIWYTGSHNIFDIKWQMENIKTKKDIISLWQYEFNYPKREMMKWYYGTIYEQNSIKIDSSGQDLSWIQKIRKNLQNSIVSAYWESKYAWLVLGMLIGDRSQITSDDYQWFIDSGLVHIIAVSGWNIIMIVVFLSAILFFLPFYARNTVILLSIIWYAMICGLDSSVVRATIMGWLSLLALFWWRELDIWRAMWTAFVVMLIVNPYFLAYDVWFLLSFSAIIWIIYFSNFIEKRINLSTKKGEKKSTITTKSKNILKKVVKEYMTPTIGATLWVLPIMLFFMWSTNLLSIIANFFVTPIIAIVMIYGFISTILYSLLPWWIWLWPEKILIDYIYFISNLTVKFGIFLQANWEWIKWTLLLCFVVLFLVKILKKDDRKG